MQSKFVEIVPPSHRQGNGIPSAAIRWPDFGDRSSSGRPSAQIFRHSDTPLLSRSPRRQFPRPTPERVLVDEQTFGLPVVGADRLYRNPWFSVYQARPLTRPFGLRRSGGWLRTGAGTCWPVSEASKAEIGPLGSCRHRYGVDMPIGWARTV